MSGNNGESSGNAATQPAVQVDAATEVIPAAAACVDEPPDLGVAESPGIVVIDGLLSLIVQHFYCVYAGFGLLNQWGQSLKSTWRSCLTSFARQ